MSRIKRMILMIARAGADRRSGLDRRIAYDLEYFKYGGTERRTYSERRKLNERRMDWVQISPWSSARKDWPRPLIDDEVLPHTFLHSILK